jgi:hypothetical protein
MDTERQFRKGTYSFEILITFNCIHKFDMSGKGYFTWQNNLTSVSMSNHSE